MGEMRNAYVILVGKYEEMRPTGTPRRVWDDNLKICKKYGNAIVVISGINCGQVAL
jgi:hypothetical protein